MTTNFIGTLLTNSPTYTVTSGFSTLLYDAYGSQTVTVSSGGSLSLVGAMGANTIRLHGNADAWQVMRSGSTTIFIHTNGDRVEVPAIVDQQTISFADQSAALRIDTSGVSPVVKLGLQVIGTSASAIDAWSEVNPETPGASSEQAPWTLLMKYRSSTLVSDGSASGTHSLDVAQYGIYSQFVVTPDLTKALSYGSGQGIWSISSPSTAVQLTSVDYSTSYMGYSTFVEAVGESIAFIPINSGVGVLTDGSTVQESNLDFGVSYLYGLNYVKDPQNGIIWSSAVTGPYGNELVKINLNLADFNSTIVSDINPGDSSSLEPYPINGVILSGGRYVFRATDGNNGYEPWVSDGTEVGTFMLRNLRVDEVYNESSSPDQFTQFGSKVAFTASICGPEGLEDDFGRELVFTDGTSEGTLWLDIHPIQGWGSDPQILGVAGELLFFKATDEQGLGLFSTDGLSFSRLAPISDGASLIAWTDQVAYFSASDTNHGRELWALNFEGGGQALNLVKDILPGSGSSIAGYNQQSFLIGDKLAFTAYIDASHQGFYLTDGTESGTVMLSSSTPIDSEMIGSNLYFTDASGTYGVNSLASSPEAMRLGGASTNLQVDSNQIFFLSNQDLYTVGVEETIAMRLAENVAALKVVQEDALYFIQQGSDGNLSLWFSDGTEVGTHYIEDLPTDFLLDYDLDHAVAIRTIGVGDSIL